ncbi:MAG: lipase family protein, partial [Ramlibacter sp.]
IADNSNPAATEGLTLAALFATHGYIVVAPNYAGYDSSPLGYHPFLNAQQEAAEMMDALTAAKAALPALTPRVTASAKLFLTGYSQGGHAAMATQRAMQQAGIPVTASAPMSGPYALAQELDDNFAGQVHTGATLFGTLLANSMQKSYGNVYSRPADLYESTWADGIESLLPGPDAATLANTRKLPEYALFSATAPTAPPGSGLQGKLNAMTPPTGTAMDRVFARGFGASNLFTNSARLAYLLDMMSNPDNPRNGLRIAARANDLRGSWVPAAPMLMCGAMRDATVSFATNTLAMQRQWASLPPGLVTVLDIDDNPANLSDPFVAEKLGFAVVKEATVALARLKGDDPEWELARNYHAGAFPFCASAVKRYFSIF